MRRVLISGNMALGRRRKLPLVGSHLEAMACQDVAAAIREMEVAADYEEYVKLCDEGTCSGRLYRGDDGRWYFYLGL